MGFSPQQLERMLSQLDLVAKPQVTRPLSAGPLGVTPEYFLPQGDSVAPFDLPGQSYTQGAMGALSNPVGGEPGPLAPIPSTSLPGFSPPAKPPAAPIAELPDRTLAAEPQRDSVASRTIESNASGIPDDFSEFSGKAPRQAALPKGAKNVQCHSIERDPDTGLVSKVYTYSMESSDGA